METESDQGSRMKNETRVRGNLLLKQHSKTNLLFILMSILAGFAILGCEENRTNRTAQCEPIFQIAHSVTESHKNISYVDAQQPVEMKSWLQAASKMDSAANNIQALKINDSKLIQYQHQLTTIYRIYSQATYDAVRARENKNLEALKSARNDATKAGKMQQSLIQEINAYCLDY